MYDGMHMRVYNAEDMHAITQENKPQIKSASVSKKAETLHAITIVIDTKQHIRHIWAAHMCTRTGLLSTVQVASGGTPLVGAPE
jgi:hypothetical protein